MSKYAGRWTTVKVDIENSIGWITLNRPEKRNAMSPTLNREMIDVLETLELDEEAQVIVLTGAGDSWTAGMDLKVLPRERRQAGNLPGAPAPRLLAMAVEAAAHVLQADHRDGQRLVLRRRVLAAGGVRPRHRRRRSGVRPVGNQLGHPAG
jgi:enoyl-CoA hydratase/carnithine racemase